MPPGGSAHRGEQCAHLAGLHLRFELEQALLGDDLATSDLPTVWNQKYHEPLGVSPSNDAEGCL